MRLPHRSTWTPLTATRHATRPLTGSLIAHHHAVWRVTRITFPPMNRSETRAWTAAGRPDPEQWRLSPYHVWLDYVGGMLPPWVTPGSTTVRALVKASHFPPDEDDDEEDSDADEAPASTHPETLGGEPPPPAGLPFRDSLVWYSYPPDGRWPQCSCCGEPMPCRAAMNDAQVADSMAAVETLLRRGPGDCWGCGQPVRPAERSAVYPGENLDLPGGPEVRFHARRSCFSSAVAYELRWLAADVSRVRVLSWPRCHGVLMVHADGTSECRNGNPDCRGHTTHDHGSRAACHAATDEGCPRGCQARGHPGTAAVRKVKRERG